MNKIILMGRLTADPDIRYGGKDNQMCIARFSLAVDRRYRREGDEVTADFFNCSVFGKQAEFVEKYLRKGIKVLLSGSVQNNNYTDRNGNKQYSVQVVVNEIEFAESKKDAAQPDSDDQRRAQYHGNASADSFVDVPDDIPDEGLPFN